MEKRENTTGFHQGGSSLNKFTPPDGGYGWIICFAVFMSNLFSHGPLFCFGILFQPLVNEFKSNHTSVAFIGSLMVFCNFSAPVFASPLINRYGCKKLCMFSSLLSAIGFSLTAVSSNLYFVCLGYGVFGGVGLGISFLASIVQCNEYFEKRRSVATGLAMCGSSLAILVIGPLSSYILEHYGWRIVTWTYVLLNLVSLAWGLLLKPLSAIIVDEEIIESATGRLAVVTNATLVPLVELSELPNGSTHLPYIPVAMQSNEEEMTNEINGSIPNESRNLKEGHLSLYYHEIIQSFQPVGQPLFTLLIVHKLFVYFALFTPFTFLPNMIIFRNISSDSPIDHKQIGTIISIIGGGDALGRLFFGLFCDYFGINALVLTSIICLLASGSTLMMIYCQSFVSYMIFSGLYGLSIGPVASLSSTILVDLFGIGSLASNYSLVLFFQGIFTVPGIVFGGYLFDYTSSYEWTFATSSLCFVIGSVISHITYLSYRYKKYRSNG